jgi:hypothetical protein
MLMMKAMSVKEVKKASHERGRRLREELGCQPQKTNGDSKSPDSSQQDDTLLISEASDIEQWPRRFA